jgi:calpain-7
LAESSPRRYTLVISQYEKTATLHFTLRVYSSLPFTLKKIGDPYKHKKEIVGEWSEKNQTAGGCGNNRETYPNNPRYQVEIHILILKAVVPLKSSRLISMNYFMNLF